MKKNYLTFLLCFFSFIFSLTSCLLTQNGDENSNDDLLKPGYLKSFASLKKAEKPEDVLAKFKERLTEYMEKQVDENYENASERVCEKEDDWSIWDIFGGTTERSTSSTGVEESVSAPGTTDASTAYDASETSGANEYSETNVQVAGVDEADFIKNDGSYIYIISNNSFKILDAWPPEEAKELSSTVIDGTPKKLFIYNDRALIFSSVEREYISQDTNDYDMELKYSALYNDECTYGYDCDFTGDGRDLEIQVYDIKDKNAPILERKIKFDGSYINSRRINNIAYTVVSFPEKISLSYWPSDYGYGCYDSMDDLEKAELEDAIINLKNKNKELINSITLSDILPKVVDTNIVNGVEIKSDTVFTDFADFYLSESSDSRSFLSLMSLKIDEQDDPHFTTILGKPGAVYASSESLYVGTRHYYWDEANWPYEGSNIEYATVLHKFQLSQDEAKTTYVGSGVAKGSILNQFSMDEYNGYIRIAASNGAVPNQNVHSTLSVLADKNGELKVVGMVDNIAPGEDIRSVRFNGALGFVVTFKKTDPLFVVDLSNPEKPEIKGELKIPGFSTYMQMIDETHILSIGYDAEDMESFAWYQGILLQIFDVSNPENPTLTYKETIGTRGSTSEAAVNHLAFNYFPNLNLLALPMTKCEESDGGGNYGQKMTFSGLMVYEVTAENGFSYKGGISHREVENKYSYYSGCYSWWTDSNSNVKRSIFMDDYVYSVADDLINISRLSDLENPINQIELE